MDWLFSLENILALLFGLSGDATSPVLRSAAQLAIALLVAWVFDWWWSVREDQKRREGRATWTDLDRIEAELSELQETQNNPVRFVAKCNIFFITIFVVGTLYLAGPNLIKWSDASKALARYFPSLAADTVDQFIAILFFVLAIYFVRKCRNFYKLCVRHINFLESERNLRARWTALRRKVKSDPDRVVGPDAASDPAVVASVDADPEAKARAAHPSAQSPEASIGRKPADVRAIPKWQTGIVTQWPKDGYFGFIDGDKTYGDGEGGVVFWTNLSRLAVGRGPKQAPTQETEVAYLEHPKQFRADHKVAVLVCPEGGRAVGRVKSYPTYKGYCFAEISDDQGNKADILVIPDKGERLEWIEVGLHIAFTLSRNMHGPIGKQPQLAAEPPPTRSAALVAAE